MKKIVMFFFCFTLLPHMVQGDIIVTHKNQKYNGKVVKITEKGFVIQLIDGNAIVLPKDNVSMIYRGNELLDLKNGMRYRISVNRPYLPFAVLGAASGGYAIKRYNDYQKVRKNAKSELQGLGPDTQNTKDEKKILAESILWGIVSVGSFYIALKPVEMKIPIGRINLSVGFNQIQFALHF